MKNFDENPSVAGKKLRLVSIAVPPTTTATHALVFLNKKNELTYPTIQATESMAMVNGSRSVEIPSLAAASYQTLSLPHISGSAASSVTASVCDSACHTTSAAPSAIPSGCSNTAGAGTRASASPAIADQNSSPANPGVGTQLPSSTDMLIIISAASRISRLLHPCAGLTRSFTRSKICRSRAAAVPRACGIEIAARSALIP